MSVETTAKRATDELPTVTSLDELARYVEERPGLCVRYSKGPDHDRDRTSIDYESGLVLPGLSANPLGPDTWWTRDIRDWIARQICHYVHLQDETGDRRPWVLLGSVAGFGPDREPLLSPWEPVAWLSDEVVDEARRRYHENFESGSDST